VMNLLSVCALPSAMAWQRRCSTSLRSMASSMSLSDIEPCSFMNSSGESCIVFGVVERVSMSVAKVYKGFRKTDMFALFFINKFSTGGVEYIKHLPLTTAVIRGKVMKKGYSISTIFVKKVPQSEFLYFVPHRLGTYRVALSPSFQ